jgi:hypothetical protein
MAVNISIDWHFVGDDEDAHVRYELVTFTPQEAYPDELASWAAPSDTVLPLGTSVLAPGLSMPVAAR